jgi:hypothetical protein
MSDASLSCPQSKTRTRCSPRLTLRQNALTSSPSHRASGKTGIAEADRQYPEDIGGSTVTAPTPGPETAREAQPHFKELQVLGAANTLQKRTAEAAIQTANKLTREVRLPPKKSFRAWSNRKSKLSVRARRALSGMPEITAQSLEPAAAIKTGAFDTPVTRPSGQGTRL